MSLLLLKGDLVVVPSCGVNQKCLPQHVEVTLPCFLVARVFVPLPSVVL